MVKRRGFALVYAIAGVAIAGIGTGAVLYVARANAEQQQQLASQAQRETYTTFQQEVALEGIDPSLVANPLDAVVAGAPGDQSVDGKANSSRSNVSQFYANTTDAFSQVGAAVTNAQTLKGVTLTGERSGGLGYSLLAGGTPVNSLVLNSPVFVVGPTLQASDFPATSWLAFPVNPVGTKYRYTTDGTAPTSTSPEWTTAVAAAISITDFPGSVTIAAFNPNPDFMSSPVVFSGNLAVQLPTVVFTRASGASNTGLGFTFSDLSGGLGLNLASAITSPALPGVSLQFTTNGSDPVLFGGTYANTSVVPPLANWDASGNATVKAVLKSTNSKYLTGSVAVFGLSAVPVQLPTPVFVTSNALPLASGTIISISLSSTNGDVKSALNASPNKGSAAGKAITVSL